MEKIQSLHFKLTKNSTKNIDIVLNTQEGDIKASLTCEEGKNLGGNLQCECSEDRKQFYKEILTPILRELVKYKFKSGCSFFGEFHRANLDRTIIVRTNNGECLFRGSSQFSYEIMRSVINLKCMRSGSTIQSSDVIEQFSPDVQHLGVLFDSLFYK